MNHLIDLHTHSIFSDGELIPSELIRRAENKGLKAIGITDHTDTSNIDFIIPRIISVSKEINKIGNIKVIPGIEITHVHPKIIESLIKKARNMGAKLIVVHGETIVEPVSIGTNRAAIKANADILAHPGLITKEDAMLAKKNNVLLEITAREGHCLTNGHVAVTAKKTGAKLVINTDTHAPEDLISKEFAKKVVIGAGLLVKDFENMQANAYNLIKKL